MKEVSQMDLAYLITTAVLLTGICLLLQHYQWLKESFVNWLYLLSGGLALYSVETAAKEQAVYITAMIAILLCLIPSFMAGILSHFKSTKMPNISMSNNCTSSQ